ncbi:RNA methyltransferase [soil metagenome]
MIKAEPIKDNVFSGFSLLKLKKYRQKYNNFIVEGQKMLESLSQFQNWEVEAVLISYANLEKNGLPDYVKALRSPVFILNSRQMEKISSLTTPPEILAIVKVNTWDITLLTDPEKVGLYLDGISDPGNLGTIIRIADWFGIDFVACSDDSVEWSNQKVVQATMGSIFKVPIFYLTREDTWEKWQHMPCVIADINGQDVSKHTWQAGTRIFIGSESHGISTYFKSKITSVITISGAEGRLAESLNAGTAAAIIAHSYSISLSNSGYR